MHRLCKFIWLCLMVVVSFGLLTPLSEAAGTSIFAGKVIALDAGHGGPNLGARGPLGSREKDNVLATVYRLKQLLEAEGARVVLTRWGDYMPGLGIVGGISDTEALLSYRARIANQAKAEVLVSIHNDWNKNSAISGTTTYYWGSPMLARCVQDHMVKWLWSRNVGTIRSDFYILTRTWMPAVLVEAGFISNAREERLLRTDWYQSNIAKGIREGLRQYFLTYRRS